MCYICHFCKVGVLMLLQAFAYTTKVMLWKIDNSPEIISYWAFEAAKDATLQVE